jgi:hypothetical protein
VFQPLRLPRTIATAPTSKISAGPTAFHSISAAWWIALVGATLVGAVCASATGTPAQMHNNTNNAGFILMPLLLLELR